MGSVSARVETLNEVGDLGGAGARGGFLAAGELDLLGLRAGLQPEAFVLDAAFAGDRGDQQQGCVEVRWVVGEAVLEAVDHVEVLVLPGPSQTSPGSLFSVNSADGAGVSSTTTPTTSRGSMSA